jgi:hypothetical protein
MSEYTRSLCAVPGCEKFSKTRGWCSAHYERWRRNGFPGPAGDARVHPKTICSVRDCSDITITRGWCSKHLERWRHHGDPVAIVRKYDGGRRRRSDGYVDVWEPGHPLARADGYVAEHRKMAWDAGILHDACLHVHHVNENKSDNRLDNFEPKSSSKHTLDHVEERGWVINQYGVWSVKPRHKRIGAPKSIRFCLFCDKQVPMSRKRDAVYCGTSCQVTAWKHAHRK